MQLFSLGGSSPKENSRRGVRLLFPLKEATYEKEK